MPIAVPDAVHAAYLLTAAFSASAAPGVPVYRYEFRAAGGHPGQKFPGAVHASDLEYVFRSPSPYEPYAQPAAQITDQQLSACSQLRYPRFRTPDWHRSTLDPEQDALAKQMQLFWGELARNAGIDPRVWPSCPAGVHPCKRIMIFDTPNATLAPESAADDGSAAVQCGSWAEFM